jgi:hypothetical protein
MATSVPDTTCPSFIPRDFAEEQAQHQSKSAMGLGRPFPPDLPSVEAYVVEFDGPNDPWMPNNWSSLKK